jgi:glycosyltransferase involved in cell wall biosynthesis
MNIVICCTLNASSHSKQFQILAEDLVKGGHTVIFVSDKKRTQESNHNNLTFLHWPNYTPTKFQDFRFIYRIFKKYRVDVLLTNFSAVNFSIIAAYLANVKKRIPWLRTLYQDASKNPSSIIQKIKNLRKSFVYLLSSQLIIVSKALQKEIGTVYLVNSKKVRLITNSVEPLEKENILSFQDRSKIITCVGLLELRKGQDILIKAFKRVVEEDSEFQLHLIGQGNKKEEYENLIRSEGLEYNVKLLGQLHPKDLYNEFQISHFSVLPSRTDATPKVVLESMRFGTPVIGSDIEGISNMIKDREDGLVFRTEDANDLAEKMIYLINNPGKWKGFHKEILRTFNDKHSVKRWKAEVKKLLKV